MSLKKETFKTSLHFFHQIHCKSGAPMSISAYLKLPRPEMIGRLVCSSSMLCLDPLDPIGSWCPDVFKVAWWVCTMASSTSPWRSSLWPSQMCQPNTLNLELQCFRSLVSGDDWPLPGWVLHHLQAHQARSRGYDEQELAVRAAEVRDRLPKESKLVGSCRKCCC